MMERPIVLVMPSAAEAAAATAVLRRHRICNEILKVDRGTALLELLAGPAPIRPVLAVIDLAMRDPSGIELLRVLRARAEWRSIPVLAIAGPDENETAREAIRMGSVSRCPRPLDLLGVIDTTRSFGIRWELVALPPDSRAHQPKL